MAETRALAQAIRFGANIPETSMVELSPDQFGKLSATKSQKKYIKDLFNNREVPNELKQEVIKAGKNMTFSEAKVFIPRLENCKRMNKGPQV